MKTLKKSLLLLSLIMLSACSSSGDSGSGNSPPPANNPPPTGGIGRTGIALGPVTNFGSIFVNGVRYDTAQAAFTINGSPGTEDDLRVGDIVTVTGTIDDSGDSGTAEEVGYDEAVKGPVQSIDIPGSALVVLGQDVLVRIDTSFDDGFTPASIEGVSVGQIVEVSGHVDANGDIVATRIEPKPAATEFEVKGTVSSLDNANSLFNINDLVVDFSAATLDNFPGGQISDGDFVEAKGTSLGASGELLATKVELRNPLLDPDEGDHLEIEGFITRFVSAQDFDVAGQPVTTNGSTVFVGGAAGDLGLNIKVEVEGQVDASGILVATEVDIRRAKAVRTTALLDSVDAAGNSVVMLGITVNVDQLTRFEDKSDADVDPLTIGDLSAGDYVEVRGDESPAGSGAIRATIFEREDPDARSILQGFVESVSQPSLTILGVTIETSAATVFRDENDAVIPAAQFFGRLQVNDLVKAEGLESADTVITADEVEFELEF